MQQAGIIKHCKSKHRVTYKWCRPCETFVLKKQYRIHIQSPLHKEVVNDAEKHSSHETDDQDDFEDTSESKDLEIIEANEEKTAVATYRNTDETAVPTLTLA